MPIQLNNSITQSGNAENLYLPKSGGTISGDLLVTGTETVQGGAIIQNGLNVTNGAVIIGNSLAVGTALTVTGASNLNGRVSVAGNNAFELLQGIGGGTNRTPITIGANATLDITVTGNKLYLSMGSNSQVTVTCQVRSPLVFGQGINSGGPIITQGTIDVPNFPDPFPVVDFQFIVQCGDLGLASSATCAICWV